MTGRNNTPIVGIGYRTSVKDWTETNLDHFDMLEITVDHCLVGGDPVRSGILDLVGRIPLLTHGIGLSLGTDVPLDLHYLDEVAALVDRLKAPVYSEHLAFTRAPGRDLANLLPLPQTEAVAEAIIAKVRMVQSRIGVPVLLENITYQFTWPESTLSDVEFIKLICRETGVRLLLDVENLHINAENNGFNPYHFLDALPAGLVAEVHMAGGHVVDVSVSPKPFLADSHAFSVTDETFRLFNRVLDRQDPSYVVVERDARFEAMDEVLDDLARIRACLERAQARRCHDELSVA